MLFEGWGLSHANRRVAAADGWAYRSHPFHPDNNINAIQGDVNGDGNVLEVHSLASPAITALQEAYIRKVVDTVNDLDNVLCEVANEGGEKEWNWWVVKTVQEYERTKPKQHPVGITGHGGERTDSLLLSPADWISPGGQDGYRDPAPAWNEKKVSLLDTDHIWGVGGNHGWVWRSFLRGHNPIFMDPYDGSILGERFDPKFELLRRNMGYALRYARKMDLAAMTPRSELASTGFCLANPGREYLIYLPDGAEATVDLSGVSASLTVEWLDPRSGNTVRGESTSGGRQLDIELGCQAEMLTERPVDHDHPRDFAIEGVAGDVGRAEIDLSQETRVDVGLALPDVEHDRLQAPGFHRGRQGLGIDHRPA